MKFESLKEYYDRNNLELYEAEDKKVLGNIIDRSLSFVPRVARFGKVRKTMNGALRRFVNKSTRIISKFESSMNNISSKIEKKYTTLLDTKVNPLMKQNKEEQAIRLMEGFGKDLEEYKTKKLQDLNTSIENVLGSYTNSIDKRIETPGYVLNVELSENGKGELRAKWQELIAKKKLTLDQKIADLLSSPGLSKIEEIVSEVNAFIEEHRFSKGRDAIELDVRRILKSRTGDYHIAIRLSTVSRRYKIVEKGLLWNVSPSSLTFEKSANKRKDLDTAFRNYNMIIPKKAANDEYYVRAYVKLHGTASIVYSNVAQIASMLKDGGEDDYISGGSL